MTRHSSPEGYGTSVSLHARAGPIARDTPRFTSAAQRSSHMVFAVYVRWEPPLGGWGFAAAGFLLPDDLPATSKRFGSFYNTYAHQFRPTAPKKNLYM